MSLSLPLPPSRSVSNPEALAAFVEVVTSRAGMPLDDAVARAHYHPESMRYDIQLEYGPVGDRKVVDAVVDGLEAFRFRGHPLELAIATTVAQLRADKPPLPDQLDLRAAAMSESDFKKQMLADFEPPENRMFKDVAPRPRASSQFVVSPAAQAGLLWVFDGLMQAMPWLGRDVFKLAFADIATGGEPSLRRWRNVASAGHHAVVRHVATLQPSLQVPPSPDTITAAVSAADAWLASRPQPVCVVAIDDDEDEA